MLWLANKKRLESLSWKINIDWELLWEYRLSSIRIDIDYGIRVNLEFLIELYLVRQIPHNTDRVVSGMILTKVLLENLEFEIELYLNWYWSKFLKAFIRAGIYYIPILKIFYKNKLLSFFAKSLKEPFKARI